MDHSPLQDLFKSLLPIIIFALWAIFSLPAKRKKKEQDEIKRRKRQQELERERAEAEEYRNREPQPQTTPAPPSKPDWQRSLEDVFEELGFPVERQRHPSKEPSGPPTQSPSHHEPVRENRHVPVPENETLEDSRSLEVTEPEIPQEKPREKKHEIAVGSPKVVPMRASPPDEHTAYAASAPSIAESALDAPHQKTAEKTSTEELRKFVVWSELLGKPVSLRDNYTPDNS